MSKEEVRRREAMFDPGAPIAVWARASDRRPDGSYWYWHSVGAVRRDATLTVCGRVIYGDTLEVTTVIGHWPGEVEGADAPICKNCRYLEFPERLTVIEAHGAAVTAAIEAVLAPDDPDAGDRAAAAEQAYDLIAAESELELRAAYGDR